MAEEFEKILEKLVASTRSPKGRFSREESWKILESRLYRLRNRRLPLRLMQVAAAAVCCVLGWWTYEWLAPVPQVTVSTLAETRTVNLPDDSKVLLNRYSSLTYPKRFDTKERKVYLQGEGYFEVSKQARKPFKVETEAVMVQVLGTHFNITAYASDPKVRTTLLEGSVAVSLIHDERQTLTLSPNESAVYDKIAGSLTLHTLPDAQEEIAWQSGKLQFKNVPLQEIAQRLSNIFRTEIRIENPRLMRYRMTASFSGDETLEEILALLCRNQQFDYKQTESIITIIPKLNTE